MLKKLQKWYRVVSLSLNELVTGRRILGGDYLSQKWKQPIGEHTKWKKFHFSYREMRYRQAQIVSFYKLCIFLLHYFPLHCPAIEFAKYIFSTAPLKDKQGQVIFCSCSLFRQEFLQSIIATYSKSGNWK